MKLSVCSQAVCAGMDYARAIRELAGNGYRDIEFWSWWDKDLSVLESLREEYGLHYVAFCTKFVSLVDPDKRSEYKAGLVESIAAAKRLGCGMLISQVGDELPDVPRAAQHGSLVEGLKEVAPILEESGVTLAIEPLNTRVNHKGYYLWDADEAFEIVGEVDSNGVKVLFDIYHQQIMQGDLLRRISANIGKIGHFHAAGNPGRHEPFAGEINYAEIARAVDALGYAGFAGLEYFPEHDIFDGLSKCREIFERDTRV